MKNNDNPISLFSFQDIVTSLTGIMVIVILVIVLQLVETVSERQIKIQTDEEYLQWKAEVQRLQENLQKLNDSTMVMSEEIRKLLLLSPEHLAKLIQKENFLHDLQLQELTAVSSDLQNLNSSILDVRKQRKELQERMREAEKKQASLQKTLDEVSNQEKELTKLLTQIEEGKRQQSNLQQQVQDMRPELEFSFSGSMQRHPLLIECMEDGFRVVSYGQNDVQHFTGKGDRGNLADLTAWLKTFDLKKTYPVLLYRGNMFKQHGKIEQAILDISPDILLGREPITSDCKTF